MNKSNAELSPLARQLLGNSGVMKLFTQNEFDAALTKAKAEIMAIAIQTTKQALYIEREECARILEEEMAEQDIAVRGVLESLAERIRSRLTTRN